MELEKEAAQHFAKLNDKLKYLEQRLSQGLPKGILYQVQREIDATNFVMEYAREALTQRGVKLPEGR